MKRKTTKKQIPASVKSISHYRIMKRYMRRANKGWVPNDRQTADWQYCQHKAYN